MSRVCAVPNCGEQAGATELCEGHSAAPSPRRPTCERCRSGARLPGGRFCGPCTESIGRQYGGSGRPAARDTASLHPSQDNTPASVQNANLGLLARSLERIATALELEREDNLLRREKMKKRREAARAKEASVGRCGTSGCHFPLGHSDPCSDAEGKET